MAKRKKYKQRSKQHYIENKGSIDKDPTSGIRRTNYSYKPGDKS